MKNICIQITLSILITTTVMHSTKNIHFTNSWGFSFQNPDEVLEYAKQFLPPNPVILEAGSHVGDDTLNMKTIWPDATMHVFEPLPDTFKIMHKKLRTMKNVHFYPMALSNHSGLTEFYINPCNTGACSINAPVHWNANEFEPKPISIHCSTLDAWADLYDISHIDFMWLDMEGHELYALQGGEKVLQSVKAIYTEISFIPVRVNSYDHDHLNAFLEAHGFIEVWRWEVGNGYGDALFIKKDLLS